MSLGLVAQILPCHDHVVARDSLKVLPLGRQGNGGGIRERTDSQERVPSEGWVLNESTGPVVRAVFRRPSRIDQVDFQPVGSAPPAFSSSVQAISHGVYAFAGMRRSRWFMMKERRVFILVPSRSLVPCWTWGQSPKAA